jgi:hypothetical protein
VDVTVGGYAGRFLTLHVAIDAATREDAFADCDEQTFASYTSAGHQAPDRFHQGPGQVDEMWILDVDGGLVILDAMYAAPAASELIDDVRALAESATFD